MTLLKLIITEGQFPQIRDIVKIRNIDKWYKIRSYAENLSTKDDDDNCIQYVYARAANKIAYLANYDKILPYEATIEGP